MHLPPPVHDLRPVYIHGGVLLATVGNNPLLFSIHGGSSALSNSFLFKVETETDFCNEARALEVSAVEQTATLLDDTLNV